MKISNLLNLKGWNRGSVLASYPEVSGFTADIRPLVEKHRTHISILLDWEDNDH